MNAIDPESSLSPAPRRGLLRLGAASLVFMIAFLPAPLAVLYELNDECLRATSWDARGANWGTLWQVPKLPVSRGVYGLVRGAVIAAFLVTLFLGVAAAAAFRSRAGGVRLHAVYVALQVVLMVALMLAGHGFSKALDAEAARRDWLMHLPSQSSVRLTAMLVGVAGLVYPMVLVLFYLWARGGTGGRGKLY